MNVKALRSQRIKYTIRKKISGTAQLPRLSVFRSNKDIYAQMNDDVNGNTLASACSRDQDIASQKGTKTDKSKMVGEAVAKKAVALGLASCVFDRGGFLYHGRIKAVAEGAREGGLKF